MVTVRIPYYRVKNGNGIWEPTSEMRDAGLRPVACGPDGPDAWARAQDQNTAWARLKAKDIPAEINSPRGSLDEAFRRYRAFPQWGMKAPRTQEDWERAWRHIELIFGDCAPSTVTLDLIFRFRQKIEREISTREAHRCIKIWRVVAAQGYCQRDADPSLGVRNREPERRQAVWTHRDARNLMKGAWRAGFYGLAGVIAVALDSSLSPIDVRKRTPAQCFRDGQGDGFTVSRAKAEPA